MKEESNDDEDFLKKRTDPRRSRSRRKRNSSCVFSLFIITFITIWYNTTTTTTSTSTNNFQNTKNFINNNNNNKKIMIKTNDKSNNNTTITTEQQQQIEEQQHSSSSSNTTTNNYIWMGNHWIPPVGVPTYRPEDYRNYFRHRNVLFVGDSLARRFYGTLYGIINASNLDNILPEEIDAPSIIDINKGNKNMTIENCTFLDRYAFLRNYYYPTTNKGKLLCRNIPFSSTDYHERINNNDNDSESENLSSSSTTTRNKGKFDLLVNTCFHSIKSFFLGEDDNNVTSSMKSFLTNDYDLIVVMVGIWDTINRNVCRKDARDKNTTVSNVKEVLNVLKDVSSSQLQIAFRTTSFKSTQRNQKLYGAQSQQIYDAQDFFKELKNNKTMNNNIKKDDNEDDIINMTLVDWGSVIIHRSFDNDRIEGDIDVHYGLEARLLFAQQLLHQLLL